MSLKAKEVRLDLERVFIVGDSNIFFDELDRGSEISFPLEDALSATCWRVPEVDIGRVVTCTEDEPGAVATGVIKSPLICDDDS